MSRLVDRSGRPFNEVTEVRHSIAICIPTHSIIPMGFAFDLANMCGWMSTVMPKGTAIFLYYMEGTYVHTMRQDLVEKAIDEANADTIIFLDSDMRFPRDTIVRLMSHREYIVGTNYAYRKIPTDFVAIKERSPDNVTSAKKLWTTEESTGLEPVFAFGFGVSMIRTEILSKLGPPPWFRNDYDPELKRFVGEDVYFCLRAQEADVPVFVDHDLSKEVAHIGHFEYTPAHAEEFQLALTQGNIDGPDNGLQQPEVGSGDVAEPERSDE